MIASGHRRQRRPRVGGRVEAVERVRVARRGERVAAGRVRVGAVRGGRRAVDIIRHRSADRPLARRWWRRWRWWRRRWWRRWRWWWRWWWWWPTGRCPVDVITQEGEVFPSIPPVDQISPPTRPVELPPNEFACRAGAGRFGGEATQLPAGHVPCSARASAVELK